MPGKLANARKKADENLSNRSVGSPTQNCPLQNKNAAPTTSNCKDMKNHVQEGDIVVRGERGDDESEFIAKVSRCNFSHAGIVARNEKGELVVVDAYVVPAAAIRMPLQQTASTPSSAITALPKDASPARKTRRRPQKQQNGRCSRQKIPIIRLIFLIHGTTIRNDFIAPTLCTSRIRMPARIWCRTKWIF
jgi:hypothetical protein